MSMLLSVPANQLIVKLLLKVKHVVEPCPCGYGHDGIWLRKQHAHMPYAPKMPHAMRGTCKVVQACYDSDDQLHAVLPPQSRYRLTDSTNSCGQQITEVYSKGVCPVAVHVVGGVPMRNLLLHRSYPAEPLRHMISCTV